jgi:hypothetical protein
MDSMDNIRERFEALAQQTEHLQQHPQTLEAPTSMIEWRRRWGRIPSSCSQPPGQGF